MRRPRRHGCACNLCRVAGELMGWKALEAIEARLQALMVTALAGDAAAYRALLVALSAHLRAYFRRRAGRDPVEDLVQETLIAVHNQRHTYETAERFTPWVHAIAKYKLIDFLRREGRRPTEALTEETETALVDQQTDDAAEARRDLALLLAGLPPRYRLPIEQVKLAGYSVEEVAAATGMSVSAIKVGIHRGMKLLARRLTETRDADG
jgi:RNA polymerase sigma-70 factor, ECF subfamily